MDGGFLWYMYAAKRTYTWDIYIYIYICAIYVWILEVLQEAIRQSCKTLECTVKSKNGAILSYCHDGKKLKDHQVSFNSFAEWWAPGDDRIEC